MSESPKIFVNGAVQSLDYILADEGSLELGAHPPLKMPCIKFSIVIDDQYIGIMHEFDISINRIHALLEFIEAVCNDTSQTEIIDSSECFAKFTRFSKMESTCEPASDVFNLDESKAIHGYQTTCKLLERVKSEIHYHVYGKLCFRDALSTHGYDNATILRLVERVKPGETTKKLNYKLYKIIIREDEHGFKIIFSNDEHIGYHDVTVPNGRKIFNKKTFMNDVMDEYGISFNKNLNSVNLGTTKIKGLINVTRVFLLLISVSRFTDLQPYLTA